MTVVLYATTRASIPLYVDNMHFEDNVNLPKSLAELIVVNTMASKSFVMVVVLLATVLSSMDAASAGLAQVPAECEEVAFSVMYCTSYMIAGSNLTEPDNRCCPGIQRVMDASPDCLCPSLVLEQEMGFKLDMTRALGLPKLCRVEIHSSITNCDASNSPSPSPSSPSPERAPPPAPTPESPEAPPAEAPGSSPVPARPSAPPIMPTPASPGPAGASTSGTPAPQGRPGASGAGDLSVPVIAILVALAVAVLSHLEY